MAIATPLNPDQPILPPDTDASEGDEQEGLVEYEGMLVSASAAQRRRCCAHSDVVLMNERKHYTYSRQFGEKPSIILGCSGSHECVMVTEVITLLQSLC